MKHLWPRTVLDKRRQSVIQKYKNGPVAGDVFPGGAWGILVHLTISSCKMKARDTSDNFLCSLLIQLGSSSLPGKQHGLHPLVSCKLCPVFCVICGVFCIRMTQKNIATGMYGLMKLPVLWFYGLTSSLLAGFSRCCSRPSFPIFARPHPSRPCGVHV